MPTLPLPAQRLVRQTMCLLLVRVLLSATSAASADKSYTWDAGSDGYAALQNSWTNVGGYWGGTFTFSIHSARMVGITGIASGSAEEAELDAILACQPNIGALQMTVDVFKTTASGGWKPPTGLPLPGTGAEFSNTYGSLVVVDLRAGGVRYRFGAELGAASGWETGIAVPFLASGSGGSNHLSVFLQTYQTADNVQFSYGIDNLVISGLVACGTTTTILTTTSTSASTTSSSSTTTSTSTTATSSSTSTTTTSVTTTTLPPAPCAPSPLTSCVSSAKAVLAFDERRVGRERFKATLGRLSSSLTPGDFGQPVTATTRYTVCVYGGSDDLVAAMVVDRGGAMCGMRTCWKALGTKGYKYSDRDLAAAGIAKIVARAGEAGSGKLVLSGKNNSAKGHTALPTGVAALLADATSATVQVLTSDASCFAAAVEHVRKADGTSFKATSR